MIDTFIAKVKTQMGLLRQKAHALETQMQSDASTYELSADTCVDLWKRNKEIDKVRNEIMGCQFIIEFHPQIEAQALKGYDWAHVDAGSHIEYGNAIVNDYIEFLKSVGFKAKFKHDHNNSTFEVTWGNQQI
jgi:hypothetical protein